MSLPFDAYIEAAFREFKRQATENGHIEDESLGYSRRGDIWAQQSGYGPGDERSEIAIDVRKLVIAMLGDEPKI